MGSRIGHLVQRARALLPRGAVLTDDEWWVRHRAILAVLWLHGPAVAMFATFRGKSAGHSAFEGGVVLAFAAIATPDWGSRRFRAVTASLGLLLSSAVLVHLSGGMTEMHFHFFVMISVITLYQDWPPYLIGIALVAFHHGVVGLIEPHNVFDHADAWRSPWKWAGIHASFVLAASAASIAGWRIMESQHERSEAAILERERWFRALIENSHDVVIVVDLEGRIKYETPSSEAVLGYSADERTGSNGFDFIHPDDMPLAMTVFADILQRPGACVPLVLRGRHRDGTWRWLELQVTNMLDDPGVGGIVANFRDVSERKALEDQLAHQAFHDPLTGLPNRTLFLDRVDRAVMLTRSQGNPVGVLYVDLDDFKTVNDGLGHAAGDELLITAAGRLAASIGVGDTAARLGGDEFAVLLEGRSDASEVYAAAARILETMSQEYTVDGHPMTVTASIGITIGGSGDDAAGLLRKSDVAMYTAKSEGKARYEVFDADMHAAVMERLALKGELSAALDRGEFVAHYQPIVELATGRVVSVEALARWNHPERGVLAPAAFIDIAEETGLIVRLGRQLLQQACADVQSWSRWLAPDDRPSVSVNLSARQLQHPGLADDIAEALAASGLPGRRLVLELTESMLIADPDSAAATLARLKELGVRLAIDDFGTGYSSLSYLERFPVDILKIDKSFTNGLTTTGGPGGPGGADEIESPMLGAIVGLGHTLGLEIVAEGIESAEQAARLAELDCRLGQGYHFARPAPSIEIAATIGRRGPEPANAEASVEMVV